MGGREGDHVVLLLVMRDEAEAQACCQYRNPDRLIDYITL
jgi:hypothetical protein